MDKKTIIKYALIAVAVFAAYTFFFGSKAEASIISDVEIGNYENRIDGGEYTAADANYVKASIDVPVIGALGLSTDIEYVDADAYQLYTTVGGNLDTPFGDLSAGILFSTLEGGDNTYEFVGAYDVTIPVVNLDAVLDLGATEDGEYSVDLTTELLVASFDAFDISVGAAYGQTFESDQDFTYTLGFARIQLDALYAQLNYLDNDLYGNGYEATTDFGLSLTF